MATILCDVDCTLLDPIFQENGWYWYLQRNSNAPYSEEEFRKEVDKTNGLIEYDLGRYFPDIPRNEAFAFWQDANLYHKLRPYEDAVEVLTKLGQKHKIVFVSYCKQFHQKSKYQMLHDIFKVNLPEGHFAFLATREKWAVSGDVIIDDRHEFLNQFKDRKDCIKVKYNTLFSQDYSLEFIPDLCTSDWFEIGNFIDEYLI